MGFSGARFARRPGYLDKLQAEVLDMAANGSIVPVLGERFSLEHAAEAHRAIEERRTIGKTVLIP